MTQFKFKIGDTVVRNFDGELSMEWGQFLRTTQPTVLKVTAVRGGWVQINNYKSTVNNPYPFHQDNFSLLVEEDELPPAPESVLYREEATSNTLTARARTDSLGIQLQVLTYYSGGSVVLSPDEVLQLCHDLRRMAMELTRKEKQNA